jgi:hypothetical protein
VCVFLVVVGWGGSCLIHLAVVFQSAGKYIVVVVDVMNKYVTEDRQMLMTFAGGRNLHCSHLALSRAS